MKIKEQTQQIEQMRREKKQENLKIRMEKEKEKGEGMKKKEEEQQEHIKNHILEHYESRQNPKDKVQSIMLNNNINRLSQSFINAEEVKNNGLNLNGIYTKRQNHFFSFCGLGQKKKREAECTKERYKTDIIEEIIL